METPTNKGHVSSEFQHWVEAGKRTPFPHRVPLLMLLLVIAGPLTVIFLSAVMILVMWLWGQE